MNKELEKELAREHAMSCVQVRRFDKEWTQTINDIKAAGVDLRKVRIVPQRGGIRNGSR